MIDMHAHIIPGVDDGSGSVEETFNMIKEAKKVGFTDVFLTSHFLKHYYEPDAKELLFWKEKLQEILNNQNLDINLHSGMEIYISNIMEDLIKEKKLLTLGNSRYMLIELPLSTTVNYLDYVLYFLQSISIIPIIAHPERYKCVQENPDLISTYIDKGALIQCNYGSILELYGSNAKKVMKILLKKEQVHFLGSDCHKQKSIYTLIPEAVKKIKKITGDNYFYNLSIKNPKKVINDEEWDEE